MAGDSGATVAGGKCPGREEEWGARSRPADLPPEVIEEQGCIEPQGEPLLSTQEHDAEEAVDGVFWKHQLRREQRHRPALEGEQSLPPDRPPACLRRPRTRSVSATLPSMLCTESGGHGLPAPCVPEGGACWGSQKAGGGPGGRCRMQGELHRPAAALLALRALLHSPTHHLNACVSVKCQRPGSPEEQHLAWWWPDPGVPERKNTQ